MVEDSRAGQSIKMKYEDIKLLKQSDKSTVHLVRETTGGQLCVRKRLAGRHDVYRMLRDCPHPGLPELYQVEVSDDETTVIEEYIEGQTSGAAQLTEKQFRQVVREMCGVLEFLHGKGIIHRDIKPSNILLEEGGHVRLIDFDAARMPREGAEQDTRLLGTKGFAPPEQYGFAQTDERADIYALGVTLEQLLGEHFRRSRYQKILRKCRSLDPDRRYQSVREVRQAFFPAQRKGLWAASALILAALTGLGAAGLPALRNGGNPPQNEGNPPQNGGNPLQNEGNPPQNGGNPLQNGGNPLQNEGNSPQNEGNPPQNGGYAPQDEGQDENRDGEAELTVLPAPGNPHWDGETGIAAWDNVLKSGTGDEVQFHLRLYRKGIEQDILTVPGPEDSGWYEQILVRFGGASREREVITWNIVPKLQGNGYYYFTVAAAGDGVEYADSPYVVSDVFLYTGESAPSLAVPTGLAWRLYEIDNSRRYYATWDNIDDYEDDDFFNVTFYNQDGEYVMNNTWKKSAVVEHGKGGIPIRAQFLISEPGSRYRFTVQVYSSRPNEYSSSPMPDPAPEEYYSPWLELGPEE